MRWTPIIAAACLACAAPASAATGLDCVIEQLTEEQRQQVAQMLDSEQNPRPLLIPVLEACAREHGWSPIAQAHATAYSLAMLWRAAMRSRSPLAVGLLERTEVEFDRRFDLVTLRAWISDGVDAPRIDALFDEMDIRDTDQRSWIDGYFGIHSMIRVSEAEFQAM